jgi:hypothetical protein
MENAQVKNTERYEVKKRVEFGMLMGYYIFDNKELTATAHEFDEDELRLAQSKAGRLNTWLGND